MRWLSWFGAFALACLCAGAGGAVPDSRSLLITASIPDASDRVPARAPNGFERTDTLTFGYYTIVGGNYYAVEGETWTWDHGAADSLEGWRAHDLSAPTSPMMRRITAATWDGHGNQVAAPILSGQASAWAGIYQDQADTLCWEGGLGYGNKWCLHFVSPELQYQGSGNVSLSFQYFNDSEQNFDYTRVYLQVPGDTLSLNGSGFTGKVGVQPGSNPPPPTPVAYNRTITEQEMGGPGSPRSFTLSFEFRSDGGWSDEDGGYVTAYGPFGLDEVLVTGNIQGGTFHEDFEEPTPPWTFSRCGAVGTFFGIHPLSQYVILDPCGCELSGTVIAFHDPTEHHPVDQYVAAESPPVRKSLEAPFPSYNQILAQWDQYLYMPQGAGVFYRPAWSYYPWVCPISGITQWSPYVSGGSWFYGGNTPDCSSAGSIGTEVGVPPDCQMVRFVYEVANLCVGMFPPCTEESNETPLVDNVRIRMTHIPDAPVVHFEPGMYFQDNFNRGPVLDVTGVANADVVFNLHLDRPDLPDKLGDSLVVSGPAPTASSRYLTRLWFRVRREGPGQLHIARYRTWKAKFADFGINFVGESAPDKGRNFIFGWMDSVEVGTRVASYRFCSQFHEMDPHHVMPEQGEDNEIIWDNMLTPGTQIEYFCTSNYICTPNENFFLPDTSGQYYREFEILPGYRTMEDGRYRLPCVLYVDAAGSRRAQGFIEKALNGVLNGGGGAIPNPTTWDRYDYLDAPSSWHAPMFRDLGGNAGGDLDEFLGYRFILVNSGTNPAGSMDERDWQGFASWLTTTDCVQGGQPRQGFWASGDDIGEIINESPPLGWPPFLPGYLGASYQCGANYLPGCPVGEDPARNDTLYCTKLRPNPGCGWTPSVPIELYGNWCPAHFGFDVFGLSGGCGGKSYQRKSDDYVAPNGFAQVTYDQSGSEPNYRSVIDGYSLHHAIRPDLQQGMPGECLPDTARIVEAAADEIANVFKWTLGISDPATLRNLCIDPCLNLTGGSSGSPQSAGALVNRLYQNSPNPFNPRTGIRFSLASAGPVRLIIYDVNGRRVRTLVDGPGTAGLHEVVWDGTDDGRRPLPSGVYWSQLSAGDYHSSKKMLILK